MLEGVILEKGCDIVFKINSLKKWTVFLFAIDLIMWIFFTICDAIVELDLQEGIISNIGDIFIVEMIGLFVLGGIYCRYSEDLAQNFDCSVGGCNFITSVIWIIIGIVFGGTINTLLRYDMWIVEQGAEILNGIEYHMFAIVNTVVPIMTMLIIQLFKIIKNKFKKEL